MKCNIKQDHRNGHEFQIQSSDDSSLNPYNRKLMDDMHYDSYLMSQGKYNGSGNSKSSSIRNGRGKQQQPMEKENIPLLFGSQATTITPVSSGNGSSSTGSNRDQRNDATEIIDLVDSDNESIEVSNSNTKLPTGKMSRASAASSHMPPMKKRKLDILREGGLEVTPISNGVPNPYLISSMGGSTMKNFRKDIHSNSSGNHNAKPVKSKSDDINSVIPDVGAATPPKFQSRCMYTKTSKIFGNPKDYLSPSFTPIPLLSSSSSSSSTSSSPSVTKAAAVSVISHPKQKFNQDNLLDLTINTNQNSKFLIQDLTISKLKKMSEHTGSNSSSSRGSPHRSNNKIRTTNNDLQITLVKPQMTHVQHIHNSQNHNIKKKSELKAEEKKLMASNAAANAFQNQQQMLQALANNSQMNGGSANNNKTPDLMSQFFPNFGGINKMNPASGLSGFLNNQMNTSQQPNQFFPMLDPLYLSALYNQGLMLPPPELLQQMFKNVPHSIPISKS